ncbi:MAG: class I SAM-dependent DNA methyltransferase [Halobacteriota archaeon]
MDVFDRYAQYYDLFYRDKNYTDEVDYVDALIKKYAVGKTATILDLGCGTGGHAVLLAKKGYDVTGVDRSDAMLAIAREKKRQEGVSVELQKGDICTIDLGKRFEVAIAMFTVMGYQTTNAALESALCNAAKHLNPGGLLIFDAWFGPAVITQKPQDKILIIEKDLGSVIRLARPKLDIISQIVDVNLTVLHVENDAILDRVDETHKMRFFFAQELELMFTKTGYEAVVMRPFMKLEGELTENDWNMAVIARRVPI